MPWKETDAVDQRLRFIADYLGREWSFSELCRRYGVSRPTGYKWVQRYVDGGAEALYARSRAPHRSPNATSEQVVGLIVSAREAHPTWGPRKLLPWLGRQYPGLELPAASTVGNILRRRGLTVPRRRRCAGRPPSHLGSQDTPNASWSVDFKGQFKVQGGMCYPLTLLDGCSRFLLRCQALSRPTTSMVRPIMEAAFREYGLPTALRSDNGPPFAARGFAGLTKLSAWWLRLGIRLDRTRPGSPQDNGRLERLHRTLKAEACGPASRTMNSQQAAFDAFRREYNRERPHESLEMQTPSSRYWQSSRPYPSTVAGPVYPAHAHIRRVHQNGESCFLGWVVRVSGALAKERVAFVELPGDLYQLRYYDHVVCTLDPRTGQATNGLSTHQCHPHPRARRVGHGR